jgi:hypothetical protein
MMPHSTVAQSERRGSKSQMFSFRLMLDGRQARIGGLAFLLAACSPASPVAPTAVADVASTQPTERPSPTPKSTILPATPLPQAIATPLASPTGPVLRADHNAIDLFGDIPDTYLEAAADLRMVFIDRSVGLNISEGLDCLTAPTDEAARNHCRRTDHRDPTYSVDPTVLDWSHPGGYDRSRWMFLPWEGDCASWSDQVDCFVRMVEPVIDDYDVLSYQFSYLEVAPGSDIASVPGGFLSDNSDRSDVFELEAFEAEHPDKVVLYWTTSLARGIGTVEAEQFNEQMRQYALSHGKPLFDVADILSHDPSGNPCYDNRDGVAYREENLPDDGLLLPAICPHYTTETDGGHLGSVSAGKIRVAKAFWVLMAQIAGWQP